MEPGRAKCQIVIRVRIGERTGARCQGPRLVFEQNLIGQWQGGRGAVDQGCTGDPAAISELEPFDSAVALGKPVLEGEAVCAAERHDQVVRDAGHGQIGKRYSRVPADSVDTCAVPQTVMTIARRKAVDVVTRPPVEPVVTRMAGEHIVARKT